MTDKEDLEKTTECVTDQERVFAQNALNDFQKGNYAAALQNVNKLDNRSFDFKVLHNKLVLEYYKSDLKKTEQFQKGLNSLYSQFQLDVEKLDDVDHCVAYYNKAMILFHKRQYTQAMRIMERVYKFVEPMDESLAMQVGLLLLELHFCTRQLDKAMGLLSYLENQLFTTGPVNVKLGERLLKQVEKEPKEIKKVTCQISDAVIDDFKKKLVKYKARCYLMLHNLESAKKEIQNLAAQNKMNITSHFLQANLEYLEGNYNEAIELLNTVQTDDLTYSESGESALVMQYNNLGVIHHAMGKPHLACHYYQKAIKTDMSHTQNTKDNSETALHTLAASKYHELVYNLGISLLHAGRPANAFDCLLIAVRRYHRNSRLWLRLAECCIQVHKESNELDFDIQKKQKEMVVQVIGSKKCQKIILTKNLSSDKKYSVESESYAVPVPTLEFASLCLRNAFLLLPSDAVTSPVPLLLIPGVTPPAPPPSPGPAPSTPLTSTCVIYLRNAVLAASAYVSLCLGDYVLALEYATNLLSQPRLSGAHRLLAHLYAAEALVLMDKITDALEHLNPENVKDISLHLPLDGGNCEEFQVIKTNPPAKWFPTNMASAHAVMQYNIAVCKTLRGQFDQAAALLKQIWQGKGTNCKVPALIIMLVLYIELQLGHADVARSLIKQYSLQYRVSS